MKVTGCSTSARVVDGTCKAIIASGFAIPVAIFSLLNQIVLTNGSAIIVVKAIATRRTAPVVVCATGYLKMATDDIAGIGRTIQGVESAAIRVIARGGAISVTDFICFDNIISATGAAIIIAIIIAAKGATTVIVFTDGNISEKTGCITISGTSPQRIGCAGKCIVASLGTIPIAGFAWLDDIIGAERSTIIIVKIIAALSATAISRGAGYDFCVQALGAAGG